MPNCFVPDCNHKRTKNDCRFFTFPKNEKIRKIWIKNCRRADREPKYYDCVCSCHFEYGMKVFEPTLFERTNHMRIVLQTPEKKKPQRPKNVARPRLKAPPEPSPSLSLPSTSLATLPLHNDAPPPPSKGPEEIHENPGTSDAVLQAELYFLKQENAILQEKLQNTRMTFGRLRGDDAKVFQHTGLPSSREFDLILEQLESHGINYYMGWRVTVLSLEDQLLLALMKLRLDLQFFDLAERFLVSTTCVQNVVLSIVYAVHAIFFLGCMDKIPSRKKNQIGLPSCFAGFSNVRIILDCTEMELAIPGAMAEQKAVFSHYKQRHTVKLLIGVAPNATITFVSKLYPGSYSDKKITRLSGILSHLEAGDLVLCDKGFLIADLCSPIGVTVNIPPFLATPQFTVDEVIATRKIARARIHVERAINRLKSFKVLDFMMPHLREHATVLVQTYAALVNFQYSLLKENEQCLQQQ